VHGESEARLPPRTLERELPAGAGIRASGTGRWIVGLLWLCVLLLPLPVGAVSEWQISTIDPGPWFQEWYPRRCLREGEETRLAVGGDGLYLVRRAGQGWTMETVSLEPATEVCMDLADNGVIRIAYEGGAAASLRLARYEAGSWSIESTPFLGVSGRMPWIETDSGGTLHVALLGLEADGLLYGRLDAGGWTITTIGAAGSGRLPSLALSGSPSDEVMPHIVHWNENGSLEFTYFDGAYWWSETILDLPGATSSIATQLLLDSEGRPRVAAALAEVSPTAAGGRDTVSVIYAWKPYGAWTVETVHVFAGGDLYRRPSIGIALEPDDTPHLAYAFPYYRRLHHAVRRIGVWTIETVTIAEGEPGHVTFDLDPQGSPEIAYLDGGNQMLRVARRQGGSWAIEDLVQGSRGERPALWIDREDRLHLAAVRKVPERLIYGVFEAGSWRFEEPWVGDVHGNPAICLESTDTPVIAFAESLMLDLDAARKETTWVIDRVSWRESSNLKLWPDDQDRLYLTFLYPPDNIEICDKRYGEDDWTCKQLVFETACVEHSMVITDQGEILVGFQDGDLLTKVKRFDGNTWTLETVDSRPGMALYSALARGSGNPVIFYLSADGTALWRSERAGGGWTAPREIYSDGVELTSLGAAVSPAGVEHVVFLDAGARSLLHGVRAPAADWTFRVLTTDLVMAGRVQMVLDGQGAVHVIYGDAGRADLMHAMLPGTPTETPSPSPSATPTPAAPTPTPTPTPAPSPTGQPTAPAHSPTPATTAVPSPTPAHSPTPHPDAPWILCAGWVLTDLVAGRPGAVTLATLVQGADVDRVVLTSVQPDGSLGWRAEDLPVELAPYAGSGTLPGFPEDIRLYLFTADGVVLPEGRLLACGLRAYDGAGNASEVWPFLETLPANRTAARRNVTGEPSLAALGAALQQALAGSTTGQGAGDDPEIMLAGWMFTRWPEEGATSAELLAWTTAEGATTYVLDETGKRLGITLPEIPGSGCYRAVFPIPDVGGIPPGRWLLGLETVLPDGRASHVWPFLDVRPGAPPTPTPTPTPSPKPGQPTATPTSGVPPTPPPSGPTIELTVSPEGDTIPVNVRFRIRILNAGPQATYLLDFADGDWSFGRVADLPNQGRDAVLEHRYEIYADHTYVIGLQVQDGAVTRQVEHSLRLRGTPLYIDSVDVACPGRKPSEWDCGFGFADKVTAWVEMRPDFPTGDYLETWFTELRQGPPEPEYNAIPLGETDLTFCMLYRPRYSRKGYARIAYAGRLEGILVFDCP
jgi:hypothetical protein